MVFWILIVSFAFWLPSADAQAPSCLQDLGFAADTAPRHRNEIIENEFVGWLSARGLRYESLTEAEKATQATIFVAAQRQILEDHREIFQTEYLRGLALKRLAAQVSPRTVRFRGIDYPVLARLGGEREGSVDLVWFHDREVVIKWFFEAREGAPIDPMLAQSRLFQLAARKQVRAAELLGEDLNQNRAMMLSFEGGVLYKDIQHLRWEGKLSSEVEGAYLTRHGIYFNQIVTAFGEEAGVLTRDPSYLFPHLGNAAYVPTTGEFVVFDFH